MEHGVSRGVDPQRGAGARSRSVEGQSGGSIAVWVERLTGAWQRSDSLLELVREETLLSAPAGVGPSFIHEVAHPAAVAHALVCCSALGDPALDEALDRRLSLTEASSQSGSQRPELVELRAYRDRLRAAVLSAAPRCAADIRPLKGALEHELLHHEVLLTLLWPLEASQKTAPADLVAAEFGQAATRRKVRVTAGLAHCGGARTALAVNAFEIDSIAVMNGEYFEFVLSGAYGDRRWWSAEGWSWRTRLGRSHPLSWRQQGRDWIWHGLFEELPLTRVFDWPAIVTRAEAEAYLAWRGQRLPTEGELCRAAFSTRDGGQRRHPWGDGEPDPATTNLGFSRYKPVPVGWLGAGASDWGVLDLTGNGWEWTAEPSGAGVAAADAVLLGGSWATAADLAGQGCRRVVSGQGDGLFTKFRGVSSI